MRSRRGFSLIEAIVALVLFELAALALAATTTLVTRDLTVADRHARAFAVASDRVARLRAGACGTGTSGTMEHGNGLTEHWRVQPMQSLRYVVDSVVVALPAGRTGSVVVRGWETCGA